MSLKEKQKKIRTLSKYEILEKGIKTDDKLSQATKSLIEKKKGKVKKINSKINKKKIKLC